MTARLPTQGVHHLIFVGYNIEDRHLADAIARLSRRAQG